MHARSLGASLGPERRALLERLLQKKGIRSHEAETAIPRRADRGPAPLSFAQEAVWFLDQLEPDRALHNVPGAVRLTGELDVAALERALAEIVRRHESLRTRIVTRDGAPQQVVSPPGPFSVPVTDLGKGPRADAEAEVLRLATEEAHRVFDLEAGELFRASLLRLGRAEHVLVLNFHHIVVDGWSMGVFTAELGRLYAAFRAGERSPLEELPIHIGDFAVWQRRALEAGKLDEHLAYWRKNLAGDWEALFLPTDRARPAVQSFRGRHRAMRLTERLSEGLRELSRQHGVTTFMTLLAAFLVVLHHGCRKTDVVIGSAVAHRNRKELEGLIGFLVNMLVLRTDLSGDPPFPELLARVRETTLGAWSHQDLPLTRILREVQPDRDLSKNPLFQVEFSLLTPDLNPAVYGYGLASGMIETLELPGLVMTPVDIQYENARYDLAVFLWDMPLGIQGTVEYASDLFEDGTISRFVERYERVLRRVVERPDTRLSELTRELEEADLRSQAAAQESYEQFAAQRLKSLGKRRSGGAT